MDALPTDERIGEILKKLKEADELASSRFDPQADDTQINSPDNDTQSDDTQINSPDNDTQSDSNDTNTIIEYNQDELPTIDVLPWLNESNLDKDSFHYARLDDSNNIEYASVPNDTSAHDIASLRLNKNYLCDIDYYKSLHYVLYVSQQESTYNSSKSININNIEIESVEVLHESESVNKTTADTFKCVDYINNNLKYHHYIVFTDEGFAEFDASSDEVPYPYGESNLSRWFEKVSNHSIIKLPSYTSNTECSISDNIELIKDYKYDIINMVQPGKFVLDSSDNESDKKLCIIIKEQFSFLPLNNILGCLKYYAVSSLKSFKDFRMFVNAYFDIIT